MLCSQTTKSRGAEKLLSGVESGRKGEGRVGSGQGETKIETGLFRGDRQVLAEIRHKRERISLSGIPERSRAPFVAAGHWNSVQNCSTTLKVADQKGE